MTKRDELLERLDTVLGLMERSENRDDRDIAELVRASTDHISTMSDEDLARLLAEYEEGVKP